ncbi:hypothetical protein DIPPA_29751 [Diplonema papillatum]|nr:hypothetical protein DIPPA_29751 [Diplonema papillatum]
MCKEVAAVQEVGVEGPRWTPAFAVVATLFDSVPGSRMRKDSLPEVDVYYQPFDKGGPEPRDILARWFDYCKADNKVLITAVVYIDRVCEKTNVQLDFDTANLLLIAALTIASKWRHDTVFNNRHYAIASNIEVSHLYSLERAFLKDLDFSLHVSPSTYKKYMSHIGQVIPATQPYAHCAAKTQMPPAAASHIGQVIPATQPYAHCAAKTQMPPAAASHIGQVIPATQPYAHCAAKTQMPEQRPAAAKKNFHSRKSRRASARRQPSG